MTTRDGPVVYFEIRLSSADVVFSSDRSKNKYGNRESAAVVPKVNNVQRLYVALKTCRRVLIASQR